MVILIFQFRYNTLTGTSTTSLPLLCYHCAQWCPTSSSIISWNALLWKTTTTHWTGTGVTSDQFNKFDNYCYWNTFWKQWPHTGRERQRSLVTTGTDGSPNEVETPKRPHTDGTRNQLLILSTRELTSSIPLPVIETPLKTMTTHWTGTGTTTVTSDLSLQADGSPTSSWLLRYWNAFARKTTTTHWRNGIHKAISDLSLQVQMVVQQVRQFGCCWNAFWKQRLHTLTVTPDYQGPTSFNDNNNTTHWTERNTTVTSDLLQVPDGSWSGARKRQTTTNGIESR